MGDWCGPTVRHQLIAALAEIDFINIRQLTQETIPVVISNANEEVHSVGKLTNPLAVFMRSFPLLRWVPNRSGVTVVKEYL
jgi:hypothetical protein